MSRITWLECEDCSMWLEDHCSTAVVLYYGRDFTGNFSNWSENIMSLMFCEDDDEMYFVSTNFR